MSVHDYSDHEYEANDDQPTLISKLDLISPLHLHPNDSSTLIVVSVKLKGTKNYQVWTCAMLLALEGKNKTGFIDGSYRRSNTDEVFGRQWDKVNAVVLGWILNSISEELFLGQIFSKRAKHVWDELKETYDKVYGSVTFNLHHKINSLSQNGSSITEYYHRLNALWKQFDALVQLPRCTCHAVEDFKKHNQLIKLMQFLMGLDDCYMKIRSNILSRDELSDVRIAYAIISSEESHRVISSSGVGTSQRSQSSVFSSNVGNRSNQRPQTSVSNSRPSNVTRPVNSRNRRPNEGSPLVCENCGFNGHTIDRCLKLIGYPFDFGKRNNSSNTNKNNQNFNRRFISNNNSTGSSFTFSDEHISKLLSLIKENSLGDKGKRVQANMTGNLNLTKFLTLYDVLVVPEYSVTLVSIHKVARDSKFIVGFDESKCFLMSQDLMDVKIIEIGRQVNGLYYFDNVEGNMLRFGIFSNNSKINWHNRLGHPSDQVLSILKNDLFFEQTNIDNIPCEICQKAKQTREPFPLSEHKSTVLGELVHLDLWGPYRVVSKEGHRYFLTIVDDFTRAVWVYLLKSKEEVFDCICAFFNLIKNQFKQTVKIFRSDNGTEFVNHNFKKFCEFEGIIHQTSCSYTPQHNEIMERKHRHLLNVAQFCAEGKNQDLDHVNFFNEVVHEGPDTSYYDNSLNAHDHSDGSHSSQPSSPTIDHYKSDLGHSQGSNGSASESERAATSDHNTTLSEDDVAYGLEKYVVYSNLTSEVFCFTTELNKDFEPKNYWEACKDQHWIEAMNKEMDALYRNDTWEICDLPKDRKSLDENVYMDLPKGFYSPDDKRSEKGNFLALLVYVDGIIVTGNNVDEIEKFKEKYCLNLLSEYGLLACKPSATPLEQNFAISNEPTEVDKILDKITKYQRLIGKLIYLTHTRPDISYSVHYLSIHIVRQPKASLEAFWMMTGLSALLQRNELLEYRAMASVTSEVTWILKILRDLGWDNVFPVNLYCDSQAAIKITANPVFHERTKHLEIDLHFMREIFLSGVIKTKKISTAAQLADIITKALEIIYFLN
ncbi:putative RNA-directed DNA polymerase [Tanacetum coccineum]